MLLVLLFPFSAESQGRKVEISGAVQDSISGKPVPYATVVARKGEELLGGTTTAADGTFRFTVTGSGFRVEFSFIGFEKKTIDEPKIVNSLVNLGIVKLLQSHTKLGEVEISAERSTTEFKLDMRVFNIGNDINGNIGALDVLSQVPSVTVSIEGQVRLRGNPGVQILINGKPSVLADDESNALGSITASMIERIEVITNPSAKYQAEGTAGIINIVLKKEEEKGFNGSVSLNTGIPDNHSLGLSLNRRTNHFNFFTQIGAGYRSMPRYSESENRDLISGTTISSESTDYRDEVFYNFILGTDYHINKLNVITLSGNYAYEIEEQPSVTSFSRSETGEKLISEWERREITDATNPKWRYDLQYKREFKNNKDHTLLMSALGNFFGKEQTSEFKNTSITGNNIEPDQQTLTNFQQTDYTFKLDYANPVNSKFSIETGGQYELNDVGNDYAVFDLVNGVWVQDQNLTNDFNWEQKVLGVYGTGGFESGKWGLKLGLRAEITDLYTLLENTQKENKQNYTDLFPSAHLSRKFTDKFSMQTGYSRRIYRPRLWDLNPFFNIRNNYSIRRGNPDLKPEYSDSYEITGILTYEKISFNSSLFHLYTDHVVERVTIFENNVNITTPMNIGVKNSTGVEVNAKYYPLKKLTISGDFNYGYYSRQGDFNGQNFDYSGNQWTSRTTFKIKLPKDFELELNGNYESGYKTVQGDQSGFAFLDAGVRKKMWKGKGVINFSVRDIFETRIHESIIQQPGNYLYNLDWRGRYITLGFSYGFGKGEAMTYSGRRR